VDEFLEARPGEKVTIIKSDTEGFDFAVMKGARSSLAKRQIDLWQFEYNWRWLDCRHCIRDVFELAAECGYEVGRIRSTGRIELYDKWNPELERYFEANYCLVRADSEWCDSICDRFQFNQSNVLEISGRPRGSMQLGTGRLPK